MALVCSSMCGSTRVRVGGTCGFQVLQVRLIGLGPGSDANDPRLQRVTDPGPERRGPAALAGGCQWGDWGRRPRTTRSEGRPARRFHTQGTREFLLRLRRIPNANDPRRKRPTDPGPRGLRLLALAGEWTWARTTRGSTRQALPYVN